MPIPAAVGYVTMGIVAGLLALLHQGHDTFVPGVCERLEPYLLSQVVGQELALSQLSDAVCDHVSSENPLKPLVLSVHGPPGVGKSISHLLAARVLYYPDPSPSTQCPGQDCPGYKVLYGMDYISSEREQQLGMLRASLLEHCSRHPESLIVVEEYDKLDCSTRGFLRQLIENAQAANISLHRSIIMLESNSGYLQLHHLLTTAGQREKVSAEEAQRLLKDLMFEQWGGDTCEERADTLKMLALIDFYLPFLPLERPHIERLFHMKLRDRQEALIEAKQAANLTWDDEVIKFLTDRVDFEGAYPIEGAKEVGTLMTRHVSRALRAFTGKQLAVADTGGKKKTKQLASEVKGLVQRVIRHGHAAKEEAREQLPEIHLRVERNAAGMAQVVALTHAREQG